MPSRSVGVRISVLGAVCALPLILGGCPERTTHAAAPATTPTVSPSDETVMNVAPDTSALPPMPAAANPPTVPVASEAAPAVVLPPEKAGPPPPRRPTETAAAKSDDEPEVHPQPPQILPQLSPQDQARLERETKESTSIAERNLQQVKGKHLNADQQDLVEKIRNNLDQSQRSSTGGDWTSARNFAEKARLFSLDLIKLL